MFPFYSQQAGTKTASPLWVGRAYAVGFPVLAALLFILCTRHGIGIMPDSTRYMSLSALPWDAPLYPALLQMVAATGIDIASGAWGIGLVLSALNAFLTWHILKVATGQANFAAMGTALIIIAPQSVALYAVAMSEPLFITMIMATLIAFIRYIRTSDQRWLIAVGAGVGLASLVRFTGPALGAAIALFLLIDTRYDLKRRIADVIRILLPSALMFLGWAAISQEISGRSTGRPLEMLGNMNSDDWWLSFKALTAWIVPDEVPAALRSALFLMALGASLVLLVYHGRRAFERAKQNQPDASLVALPLAFLFFTYLGFMVLATSIEANLHLNSRYAYPVYCASIMAVTIALAGTRLVPGRVRRLNGAMIGLACVMLVSHSLRSADRTHQAWREGIGYASLAWNQSPTLAAVTRLPHNAILYSNGADVIGFVLRRHARNIPAHIMLRTGRENPDFPYASQIAEARATLSHGNAYVIFLNRVDWRFYMASEARLVRDLDMVKVVSTADGSIYRGRRAP